MAEKLNIEGREIAIKSVNKQDYISLTDIAKQRDSQEPRMVIRTYLNNSTTITFLEVWERINNPLFKRDNFITFKTEEYDQKKLVSISKVIERLALSGISSSSGRYGGTFAHRDIAFEFASWVSPAFKYNLIQEFQRLRSEEAQRQRIEWDASRELSRLNYPLQTAAIQETTGSLTEKKRGGAYASEADLINLLVFGMTAKTWRAKNSAAKGNIRDNATTLQNALIANLECINSELIRKGASRVARERALADAVEFQSKILNKKYLPE